MHQVKAHIRRFLCYDSDPLRALSHRKLKYGQEHADG